MMYSRRARKANRKYLRELDHIDEVIGGIFAVVGCIIGAGLLVALVTIIVKSLMWIIFEWRV